MIVLLRDAANRNSISILTELDSGLPMIAADRVQLQQVLMNLSISRRIIESHGGRLWANANIVRGATFQFTLPSEANASSPSTA